MHIIESHAVFVSFLLLMKAKQTRFTLLISRSKLLRSFLETKKRRHRRIARPHGRHTRPTRDSDRSIGGIHHIGRIQIESHAPLD
jgi:hypothetical protein